MTNIFRGPFFIIGKPRSGTKLLAMILGQHPDIALEVSETQFIPYYLKNRKLIENLHVKENFIKFYNSVSQTTYFISFPEHTISVDEWYDMCSDYSFYNVIEVLLRKFSYNANNPKAIWGDKSNNYVTNVDIIKKHLPTSKFIHIVRDVRDASLSSYNAWRTNVYRYSQRWFDDINKFKNDIKPISGEDYIEIRYEDLLRDPKRSISNCLQLLGLKFYDDILTFHRQSEGVGDARGMRTIKNDNVQKYKAAYSYDKVAKIESLTWPLLKNYGYAYEYHGELKRLSRATLRYYQVCDVMNRLKFDHRRSGIKSWGRIIRGMFAHFRK
jgi:hypothetical protein